MLGRKAPIMPISSKAAPKIFQPKSTSPELAAVDRYRNVASNRASRIEAPSPTISVLLPTRGRYEALRLSVGSLLERAEAGGVEMLLAVDDDDLETIGKLRYNPIPGTRLFVGPRLGYRYLHEYVNFLCEQARGDWLFLWNDDALMKTTGWDRVIQGYQDRFVVVNPQRNHGNQQAGVCIFPIVPRQWFEELGHFSLSNHNDSWVEVIARELQIREDAPIFVTHDRADLTGANCDATYREREMTTDDFWGKGCQNLMREDARQLSVHLAGGGKSRVAAEHRGNSSAAPRERRRMKIGFLGPWQVGIALRACP